MIITNNDMYQINGVDVVAIGKNSYIEIKEPVPKFVNCKMKLEENCSFILGGSNFIIKNTIFDIRKNSNIIIGENFSCNGAQMLCGKNSNIIINEDCMFSNDIIIRTTDSHVIYDINTNEIINRNKDIYINKHVWICQGVICLKGACINENSIVAMRSIVSKEIKCTNVIIGEVNKIIKKNVSWLRQAIDKYNDGRFECFMNLY